MNDQIIQQLKQAVVGSSSSRYRIAKESGVAASQLSRLVNGKQSLGLGSVCRLARYFGFEVKLTPTAKKGGRPANE